MSDCKLDIIREAIEMLGVIGSKETDNYMTDYLEAVALSDKAIAALDGIIERLKEVAAVVISNDPEDHKPVCCGGSIQDMCGCMGATPRSIAEHELRQLVETTHD